MRSFTKTLGLCAVTRVWPTRLTLCIHGFKSATPLQIPRRDLGFRVLGGRAALEFRGFNILPLSHEVNVVYFVNMIQDTPQQRRQEENRDRILAAAASVVREDGLEGLSIKKVASLANYTPGALYRYYASKDALLAALTVAAVDELAAILMDASQKQDLTSIAAQAYAYVRYSHERPAMYELLAAMSGTPRILVEDEASARAIGDAMLGALLPLAGAFGRCVNDGLLAPGDSKERAVLLWAAVQGTLQLRKQERVAPDFFNADRLSRQMVVTLLRGWGAQDTNIQDALAQSFDADENEEASS